MEYTNYETNHGVLSLQQGRYNIAALLNPDRRALLPAHPAQRHASLDVRTTA
jgi:hypothetical protein